MNAAGRESRLANVYVARVVVEGDGCRAWGDPGDCFARNHVEWLGEYAGPDGQVTWHFHAPDAESVRIALRNAGVAFHAVWRGRAATDRPAVDIDMKS